VLQRLMVISSSRMHILEDSPQQHFPLLQNLFYVALPFFDWRRAHLPTASVVPSQVALPEARLG
jgi:hypothetical protein